MKDLLKNLFSKEEKKEIEWGLYLLGSVVVICLLLTISLFTGCGKEEKKEKKIDSQIEMFSVSSEVRFMPDGLGYQSVDVTFKLGKDVLENEKQLRYVKEMFVENYGLKEEEWAILVQNGTITISTHRD